MGGGISFWRKKKEVVIERRPIITLYEEISKSAEALERIHFAIKEAPPGTKLRWQKLMKVANRIIEPTDDNKDPVRLNIDLGELRLTMSKIYEETTSVASDGITLMREYIPKMYEKHSLERGRRVSQQERNELELTDESFGLYLLLL